MVDQPIISILGELVLQLPMHRLIYHVASGEVFFTGSGMLILAGIISVIQRPQVARIAPLLGILGIIAVSISSTPLSYWFYAPAATIAVVWLVIASSSKTAHSRRRVTSALLASMAILGVALELPYHFAPSFMPANGASLTIFGDSLAAGVGDDGAITWPAILADEMDLPVHNHSQMGATTAIALKLAQQVEIPDGIVLVEIGGNDLLGSTSATEFAADLDALLKQLSAQGRQVVMFELPLPPFANAFGRAQRQLAARYNVALIPKRILAEVLAGSDSTLDSIHLSPTGHQQLARRIQSFLALLAEEKPT